MESVTQRRVPAAQAPNLGKPAGAMNSAFDTGVKVPKGRQSGNATLLPPLDISTTKAVTGMPPLTGGRSRKGSTRYDALFDTLTKDGMGRTGIPKIYKSALTSSGATYLKARPELARTSKFVVRGDGEGVCGVWRVARNEVGK